MHWSFNTIVIIEYLSDQANTDFKTDFKLNSTTGHTGTYLDLNRDHIKRDVMFLILLAYRLQEYKGYIVYLVCCHKTRGNIIS